MHTSLKQSFLLIFLLGSFLTAKSQTVLSGKITLKDIPMLVTAPFNNITTIEQLNNRITSGNKLKLQDAVLISNYDTAGIFIALDTLILSNSDISTNGSNLTIICRVLLADNSSINSFTNDNLKAGTTGINGKNGGDGGVIKLYVINQFNGSLRVTPIGQNGGDGLAGAAGRRGANGRESRDRYGDCRRCARSGSNGTNGGSGGNAGNGGNGGVLLIKVLSDPAQFPTSNINFLSLAGKEGTAAKGGKGGAGGSGGRVHGVCRIECARTSNGSGGANGSNGINGKKGTEGNLAIQKFNLTDLFSHN